ncbi:transporter [Nevskia sp.]|uniref:transporter n=1 Tax=Nevskia sp. TaxID=1929292 RepID=UPI0025EA5EDC|nr:transporter [Nevskia sp.]
MTPRLAALAALALLPAATAVQAASPDLLLDSGRFLAKYPGLTIGSTVLHDPRDEIFDRDGRRQSGVAPNYGAGSEFPLTRATVDFDWHFPLFETEALPFVSSRLWNARAVLGYADTSTKGPIAAAAVAQGAPSSKSGIHDVDLAFGPVLYGSRNWRNRAATPLSLILLGELRLPIGAQDPDSPNNAGDAVFAWGGRLGGHWQPQTPWLQGFRLDAGVRARWYAADREPAFNAQTPARTGRDLEFDATLARRLWRGVHGQVSYYHRDGQANEYRRIRTTANPPDADPLQETFPDPAPLRDAGTREQRLQFGLGAFISQRLWIAFAYTRPLAGRSGGVTVPYRQQGVDCVALGNCLPRDNGSDAIDGLGRARAYASDSLLLSLRWQPRQSRGAP